MHYKQNFQFTRPLIFFPLKYRNSKNSVTEKLTLELLQKYQTLDLVIGQFKPGISIEPNL